QVLIKLSAASVSPVETYIRSGSYARLPELPFTPGNYGAGIIHAIGDEVTKHKVGDHVYTLSTLTGSYAEYTVCEEDNVFLLHSSLGFSEGANVGITYFTAYRALCHRLGAKPGETVLVHGASGGVGTAAVQIARAYGMHVIGTAGSSKGEELVRQAGAHHVFNHRELNYTQGILEATDGQGPDVILEMLANVNLAKDLDLVSNGGRIGVIGSRGSIEINPRLTMAKECSIVGVMLLKVNKDELKEMSAAMHAGMEAGWLRPSDCPGKPCTNQ
ncbi:predicted protein, partial [Nematostella vectensis]